MSQITIPLIRSTFHNEDEMAHKLSAFILSKPRLSMGEQCAEFERVFAEKQGRAFAVFVNSGSSANLIAVQALLNTGRLKKGDKVGFAALTWSTNVMPLIQLGLTPVPIDCDPHTLNISPETLAPHLRDIKALFITNVLGLCDDIETIAKQCEEAGIVFFEDNCESLGSQAYGKLLGNFGVMSTFSTFVGHHLSTIEGGVVTTDDKELYEALIIARAHGWSRSLSKETQERLQKEHRTTEFFSRFTFYDLGYSVRPTEISGFIGVEQVKYWDHIVEKRRAHAERFVAAAKTNKNIVPLDTSHLEVFSNFAMPLVFTSAEVFEATRQKFETHGVETRPVIAGDMTAQPFYKKYVGEDNSCPNARYVMQNGFYFGNNQDLTEDELSLLESLITEA